jgi:hypothetical protein
MEIIMDIEKIYEECNEHLRETGRKRDQLMVFYSIIVGAYFASFNILADFNLQYPFIFGLILLGLIFSLTIIQYRKWHLRYGNTVNLLHSLDFSDKATLNTNMEKHLESIKKNYGINDHFSWGWLKYYLSGVEFLTFNGFLIITYLPIHIVILAFGIKSQFTDPNWIFIIDLVIYLLIANLIAAIVLYKELKNKLWAAWFFPERLFQNS